MIGFQTTASAFAFFLIEGVLKFVVAIFLFVGLQHCIGILGATRDAFSGQQVVFQPDEGFVQGFLEGTGDQTTHEGGLGAEVELVAGRTGPVAVVHDRIDGIAVVEIERELLRVDDDVFHASVLVVEHDNSLVAPLSAFFIEHTLTLGSLHSLQTTVLVVRCVDKRAEMGDLSVVSDQGLPHAIDRCLNGPLDHHPAVVVGHTLCGEGTAEGQEGQNGEQKVVFRFDNALHNDMICLFPRGRDPGAEAVMDKKLD